MEHKTQELDHMTTYAHLFSQVDLARLSTRFQPLSFLLFLVLFGGATNAHAYEVNEFDEGSDGWTIYPSTMGRTSESGWVNVGNDGEGSIRNTPNRTRYTYYWKLTKDIDLTQLSAPSLEVKFHFKGHGYDYARIQIGEEGARRLSDFTTLHESTSASTDPEELSLDLSEYAGTRVRIQLVLRKPYGVVERRIGLYVHRMAITTPTIPHELDDQPEQLRISAFNIQVFGRSKMDQPNVVTALTQIITRFDLVMIQEIRDLSEVAIQELLNEVNLVSETPYALALSERLGRTSSKEQIAFLYRSDKLNFGEIGTMPDPDDLFERPPIWATFTHIFSDEALWVLGAHLDPDTVSEEIAELYEIYARHRMEAPEGEAMVVMGDLNAGCRYLTEEERVMATLFTSSSLISLIDDDMDTTVTSTYCPYDRLLVSEEWSDYLTTSGIYRFDQELSLTGEVARAVSDHFPVWAQFNFE